MPRLNSKNRDLEVEFTLDEENEIDPGRYYGGVLVDSRYYTNRQMYVPSPLQLYFNETSTNQEYELNGDYLIEYIDSDGGMNLTSPDQD